MRDPNAFQSWYAAEGDKTNTDWAADIFQEAISAFKAELARDKTKLQWIEDSRLGSLTEVLASVVDAQVRYDSRKGDLATRRALVELSEKIHYYGAVMDVMVQHHPEYVALAWGAMKFLLVGVLNHQNLVPQLLTGLCEIADILPRDRLTLQLYPSPRTKQIVVALYAHILRFLLRALHWYQENRLKHVVHAVTKPAELCYQDILKRISSLSRSLSDTALISDLAEQRDMHTEVSQQWSIQISITQLENAVQQMKESMATEQVINASAGIGFRQALADIQLAQFIGLLSQATSLDPAKALSTSVFLRNRRSLKPSRSRRPRFWLDSEIQVWNSARESSLVMIDGTRRLRFHIRDFCTDSIIALRESNTPVIWALKAMDAQETLATKPEDQLRSVDIIKCLISQAIQINASIHTDAALTPRLKAYYAARTEEEWLQILASVLQDIPQIYIIVDLELVPPHRTRDTGMFCWPSAIRRIFADLSRRNCRSVIKAALVTYGSSVLRTPTASGCTDPVVHVSGARSGRGSATVPLRARRGRASRLSRGGDDRV